MRPPAAALALALLWPFAAAAQAPSPQQPAAPAMGDSAKGLVGSWEFSNADRDKRCNATFANTAVKGGFKVEFDADCVSLFPFVADVTGWRYPDNDNLFTQPG